MSHSSIIDNTVYGVGVGEYGDNVTIRKPAIQGVRDDIELFYTPAAEGEFNPFWLIHDIVTRPLQDDTTKRDNLDQQTLDLIEPDANETRKVKAGVTESIKNFRQLLVCELAPAMLGIDQAWRESTVVLKSLTQAEDMTLADLGIKNIMEQAFKLKLIDHVVKMLDLSVDQRNVLIALAFSKSDVNFQDMLREALKNGKLS